MLEYLKSKQANTLLYNIILIMARYTQLSKYAITAAYKFITIDD